MDLPTLTLLVGAIVTPLVTGIGIAIKRMWAKHDAEIAGYLATIDKLQERIFNMQQETIKAEIVRAASTGETNQLLKTLAAANEKMTIALDNLAKKATP
jgi:hypothetical protein